MATKAALRIILLLVASLGLHKQTLAQDHIALGAAGYSPGWTAKGHPGYSGYAWYRIRLQVGDHGQALAMLVPSNIQDAYQVFSNGRLAGSTGKFDRTVPTIDHSRPRMILLPPSGGTVVLALRLYMRR